MVKIPIRNMEEYRFIYDWNKQKHTGEGDGSSQKGDILGRDSQSGKGSGKGAGEDPGEDVTEVYVDFESLAEMFFSELVLPNLDPNKTPLLTTDKIEFNDIRKQGIQSNIHKKRTLLEAIKRNAINGQKDVKITPEDLRYRTWEEVQRPNSNAVIFAMMDTSGSMSQFEKYISRTYFFWMTQFLRTKYKNVEIRFLAHHTQAKEVTEQEFFTKGESGGTLCSSVYQLALDIIRKEYPVSSYNIYPVHMTDGDNIMSDNEKVVRLVKELLEVSNLVGYYEIMRVRYGHTLMSDLATIKDPKLRGTIIKDNSEVYSALKKFFSEEGK